MTICGTLKPACAGDCAAILEYLERNCCTMVLDNIFGIGFAAETIGFGKKIPLQIFGAGVQIPYPFGPQQGLLQFRPVSQAFFGQQFHRLVGSQSFRNGDGPVIYVPVNQPLSDLPRRGGFGKPVFSGLDAAAVPCESHVKSERQLGVKNLGICQKIRATSLVLEPAGMFTKVPSAVPL